MTYDKTTCIICDKQISKSGAAYTSHYRAHVRRGEAKELKRKNGLIFMKPGEDIIQREPYAKLGEDPLPGQPKLVWELPDLKTELPAIDPASYFTTSGEAVKKAEKLVKDVYALASKVRAFRDKLVEARGQKKYLETARDDRRLLIKGKDPRKSAEDEEVEQ
jgi:hypothetical protein